MEEQKNNLNEVEEKEIDLRALFFQYLYCWPWFIASVIICCITAFVFLRYQTPVYNVSSSVLIKEDEVSLMKVLHAIEEHKKIADMSMDEISTESVIKKIYEGGIL
jgi:uncharacterized protein involved in exopolysaccharide biosynthesis